MTSSLVGSEMCIRDRVMTVPGDNPDPNLLRGVGKGTLGDKPDADVKTVSYTHLTLPTICSV
eukprot:7181574-Prorocentrum_lima.AAC.1